MSEDGPATGRRQSSPQGITPAGRGGPLLVQKRRHAPSDLAQAQQTEQGPGSQRGTGRPGGPGGEANVNVWSAARGGGGACDVENLGWGKTEIFQGRASQPSQPACQTPTPATAPDQPDHARNIEPWMA